VAVPKIRYRHPVALCGTYKAESFAVEGGSEELESIVSEGGYAIGMAFRTKIVWTDAAELQRIRSNVASCTIESPRNAPPVGGHVDQPAGGGTSVART
jgi:hypothetical protein